MGSLQKYIVLVTSLGLLVGCSITFGASQQTVDIETPQVIESGLPTRPETLSDIQALLQSDGEDCQLPCFWGFRPGSSTEGEVLDFLEPQAIGPNAPELSYRFPDDSAPDSLFSLSFGIQEETVSLISVILDSPSEWLPTETFELPYLLSIMESSPEAYLSISLGQRRIFLTIAYDEGVLAQYPFTLQIGSDNIVSPNSDEAFLFCPELEENAFIKLRLRNEDAQFLLEEYGVLSATQSDHIWTIERMTSLSVDEFIQQIIENPDECIELPSYPELIEMGYEF